MFPFIRKAINEIKRGGMVIVTDDESRENEGDLIMAAHFMTPQKLRFMHDYGRGLVCVPMESRRAKKLNLWPIVPDELNTECTKCKFMVSVDYKNSKFNHEPRKLAGLGQNSKLDEYKTGVSFAARAHTIQALSNSKTNADDFTRPGHVVPLAAEEWGVLSREGHTEAAVDLVRLSGITPPVAVLVEVLKKDGTIARGPYLKTFARRHSLTQITIADLAEYRKY
ncbi:MAG: 3,4-dihydroxy-2-butanone-4-phosphate synthase, partial [Candidatus Jacksonbacteria bacterium]|nr:3,4-dihydroxy-2-butanone-4-phosphate synthase [Candidatus Jacksonbacteria bacterium]